MKKVLLIANWKMNFGIQQGYSAMKKLYSGLLRRAHTCNVVVCTDFVTLPGLSHFLDTKKKNILIGAQDCFYESRGTYTGEVSPQSLKELGCTYVILGHSERRIVLHESSEVVSKKVQAVLKANLTPILCVGEHKILSQKKAEDFLEKQLCSSLANISLTPKQSLAIAYEPVWAIGTGTAYKVTCDPNALKKRIDFLRKSIKKSFGASFEKRCIYMYGGSVNSKTALSFIKEGGVNGLLIGTASLDVGEFLAIIDTL